MSKIIVTEAKHLAPNEFVWINGTSDVRFTGVEHEKTDPNDKTKTIPANLTGFKNFDRFHPIFATNNIQAGMEYCRQHSNRDSGHNAVKYDVNRDANRIGRIVFFELKPDVNLFNFTNPADYKTIGISEKYALLFKNAELFFSLNTNVTNNMDARPIAFVIALQYLKYLNFPSKRGNKTLYSGDRDVTYENIFASKEFKVTSMSLNDYKTFYNDYKKANWDKDNVEFDATTGHHVRTDLINKKTGENKNTKVSEIPDPTKMTAAILSNVNLYMLIFNDIHKFYSDLGVTDPSQFSADQLAKLLVSKLPYSKDTESGKTIPGGDFMLIFMYYKLISSGEKQAFDGYYATEDISLKIYHYSRPIDSVVIFNPEVISLIKSYSFSEFNAAVSEVLNKNSYPTNADELLAVKRNLDNKQIAKLKIDLEIGALKTVNRQLFKHHNLHTFEVLFQYKYSHDRNKEDLLTKKLFDKFNGLTEQQIADFFKNNKLNPNSFYKLPNGYSPRTILTVISAKQLVDDPTLPGMYKGMNRLQIGSFLKQIQKTIH